MLDRSRQAAEELTSSPSEDGEEKPPRKSAKDKIDQSW